MATLMVTAPTGLASVAFDVDQVLCQYSRAAKELWEYCNLGQVEITAAIIREQPPHDWWKRGAPKRR